MATGKREMRGFGLPRGLPPVPQRAVLGGVWAIAQRAGGVARPPRLYMQSIRRDTVREPADRIARYAGRNWLTRRIRLRPAPRHASRTFCRSSLNRFAADSRQENELAQSRKLGKLRVLAILDGLAGIDDDLKISRGVAKQISAHGAQT